MRVVAYYTDGSQDYWLNQIKRSDWRAGQYLYELIRNDQLKELCGNSTRVLLLTENKQLISFCTYAEQDDIREPSLTPWVGFVYTFPEFRGKRYMGILLNRAYALAKADGYDRCCEKVMTGNDPTTKKLPPQQKEGAVHEMRNTLVHVRNVDSSDWQRMADHNIYATAGMLWHHLPAGVADLLKTLVPAGLEEKPYPMKSYFSHGINVSSHSDYPATSGSPDSPFGIMEIAVTGVFCDENGDPCWTEELLTREQAITALTINCAKQMFIEEERGSIREGKYADTIIKPFIPKKRNV